jgi:adsorption protein B
VWLDEWAAACLIPLAVWILLSGIDDLWITLVFCINRRKAFPWPSEAELTGARQRRIAILVPLWREHDVIAKMLEHNLAVIRYANYDFFVGVYPNDRHTVRAVQEMARRHPRVHVALCPHFGPTSKGDCLNRVYQAMAEYEGRGDLRYEIVITHDAEDLIHPESLRLVNWFSREYEMVQVPVLPLATSWGEWTHGIYCDDFAEYQLKDIPVRAHLGGFLPSNGVGTGFAREALESLRRKYGNAFDPENVTEDYENGFRMHAAGYRQIFLPIQRARVGPVATREYFPRNWRAAVRQRSRWVAGIALQGWQCHGWRVPLRQVYWFWRDRKGLAGNLLTPVANLVFVYWLAEYAMAGYSGHAPHANSIPFWVSRACYACAWIAVVQIGVRIHLSARIFGLPFAAGAPLPHDLGQRGQLRSDGGGAALVFDSTNRTPLAQLAEDRACVSRRAAGHSPKATPRRGTGQPTVPVSERATGSTRAPTAGPADRRVSDSIGEDYRIGSDSGLAEPGRVAGSSVRRRSYAPSSP